MTTKKQKLNEYAFLGMGDVPVQKKVGGTIDVGMSSDGGCAGGASESTNQAAPQEDSCIMLLINPNIARALLSVSPFLDIQNNQTSIPNNLRTDYETAMCSKGFEPEVDFKFEELENGYEDQHVAGHAYDTNYFPNKNEPGKASTIGPKVNVQEEGDEEYDARSTAKAFTEKLVNEHDLDYAVGYYESLVRNILNGAMSAEQLKDHVSYFLKNG